MKNREIIATLLEVSNDLDSMGQYDDANLLTKVAQYFTSSDPESNPDNLATEHGFLGHDEDTERQRVMEELNREDEIIQLDAKIHELSTKMAPTEEDIVELGRLLDVKSQFNSGASGQSPQAESDFVQNLQNAGAEVVDPFSGE